MAATTRTITGTIYKLDGTPWEGATLRIDRLDRPMIDSDGTIGDSKAEGTTDANGDVSLTVAVPPSGSGHYRLTHPVESGRPADATYFYMAAGAPITVGEILAASASALPEDAVQTLLNAYLSKADNLASLASAATARTNLGLGSAAVAATGDFEAAGAVAAHTDAGSGAHAATAISVTPAGNLAATDVQAALEEIQGDVDGMSSDVDDLTTTTGSSTNMLRVTAVGGLEYRTTAQVLSDIGAAPTASPTFTGTVTLPTTVASVIKPASDSTTALQLANAAGTAVLTVDTTNNKATITLPAASGNTGFEVARSGSTGYIRFGDGLAIGGRFYPTLETYSIGGNAITARIQNMILASDDTGTDPVAEWIIRATAGAIASRILWKLKNYTTQVMSVTKDGHLAVGTHDGTAYADLAASTTAAASLRIRSGTAPTAPNGGDLWFDGTNLKFYDGTTTRTISWT